MILYLLLLLLMILSGAGFAIAFVLFTGKMYRKKLAASIVFLLSINGLISFYSTSIEVIFK